MTHVLDQALSLMPLGEFLFTPVSVKEAEGKLQDRSEKCVVLCSMHLSFRNSWSQRALNSFPDLHTLLCLEPGT